MSEPTVFVIDDDAEVRSSLRWLMESAGLTVESYASAGEFLEAYESDRPGCLVLDLRLPGMSGYELQKKLAGQGLELPVIIISAYGDVPTAVRVMKAGAVDFLEKPFPREVLLERVRQAVDRDAESHRMRSRRAEAQRRASTLTPREGEVMRLVVTGKATKQISFQLGVSPRTIEVHRAQVMKKMQVHSLPELVVLVTQAGLAESERDPSRAAGTRRRRD
ncbi:MAG: response regulator transcription factor [Planctomycetota bacterium]|jgi:FixJ family two-component response regulator